MKKYRWNKKVFFKNLFILILIIAALISWGLLNTWELQTTGILR